MSGVIAFGRPVGRPVAVVGARPVAEMELVVGCTMIVDGSHVCAGLVVKEDVADEVSVTGTAGSVALTEVLFAVEVGGKTDVGAAVTEGATDVGETDSVLFGV